VIAVKAIHVGGYNAKAHSQLFQIAVHVRPVGTVGGGAAGDIVLLGWLFICFYYDKIEEASTFRGQTLGVGDDTQTILNQISFNIDRQFEIGSHRTAQVCKTFQSPRSLMDMADVTATLLDHTSGLSRQLPFLIVDFGGKHVSSMSLCA
jgi:hypothetical protein